jgi:hypothetical protein
MSQCGPTPFERPSFWCRPCRPGWSPAEPVEAAPERMVAEVDGVHVRFQDGWHEAKVGEIVGCPVGNGLPDSDPAARPPVLLAPSYVASRAPVGEFGPMLLAEAARHGH